MSWSHKKNANLNLNKIWTVTTINSIFTSNRTSYIGSHLDSLDPVLWFILVVIFNLNIYTELIRLIGLFVFFVFKYNCWRTGKERGNINFHGIWVREACFWNKDQISTSVAHKENSCRITNKISHKGVRWSHINKDNTHKWPISQILITVSEYSN